VGDEEVREMEDTVWWEIVRERERERRLFYQYYVPYNKGKNNRGGRRAGGQWLQCY